MKEGKVKEIIGVVIDVDFAGQELPPIYNALEVVAEEALVPAGLSDDLEHADLVPDDVHHHLPGGKAYQDDALRVCAGPGAVNDGHEQAWRALVSSYPDSASLRILVDAPR